MKNYIGGRITEEEEKDISFNLTGTRHALGGGEDTGTQRSLVGGGIQGLGVP